MSEEKRRADTLRQIEFYLSDGALPHDEFFLTTYQANGGIPVSTLAESPRIVTFLEGLDATARQNVIVEVIQAESDSVRIEHEGETSKAVRIFPLPSEDPKATRSIYLGGCAKDRAVEQLMENLANSRGAKELSFLPIVSIRRLRDLQRDRAYSGQLFIECEDEEKAAALLKAADKGTCGIDCNKARLLKDFFDKQHEFVLEQRAKIAAKRLAKGDGSAGGASGAPKDKRPRVEETDEERTVREKNEAELVIRFEGAGPSADRESVEALLSPLGIRAAYINYSRGESVGDVRFAKPEECKAVLEAVSEGGSAHGVKLGGEESVPTWRMLTADESTEYWVNYRERKKDAKRQRSGRGKGGGKGNYRGGYRGNNGRGRSS